LGGSSHERRLTGVSRGSFGRDPKVHPYPIHHYQWKEIPLSPKVR
jgi:hypothetical protein